MRGDVPVIGEERTVLDHVLVAMPDDWGAEGVNLSGLHSRGYTDSSACRGCAFAYNSGAWNSTCGSMECSGVIWVFKDRMKDYNAARAVILMGEAPTKEMFLKLERPPRKRATTKE